MKQTLGTGNALAKSILHNELWYVILGIRQETPICAAGFVLQGCLTISEYLVWHPWIISKNMQSSLNLEA